MSISGPALVIFHGGTGSGEAEQMLARVRVAAAQLSAATALAAGFEAAIVATDSPALFETNRGLVVDADVPDAPFDYPTRLRDLVQRHGLERPVAMGSGALPLLQAADFKAVADALAGASGPRAITNNFFSGDLTGWAPGSLLAAIGPFERDNQLPRRLRDEAGASVTTLPRSTATLFDIDTPTDAAIIALDSDVPEPLRSALATIPADAIPLHRVMPLFCDRTAQVVIAGRVGSQAWQHMERETACRVRVFSEERGMAAAGAAYRPRSILGFALEDAGPQRFFARMAEMGDALVLDRRVLEAHLGIEPSREDRFQADLGRAAAVADPVLQEFCQAAIDAPIPVVMGGHSLVAGGLMLLNDLAWAEHDRATAS